jgi:hypothetical protein
VLLPPHLIVDLGTIGEYRGRTLNGWVSGV